jgi:hypothetical protein
MKCIQLLSAVLFIFSLTSCTFTEDIYINPDGSGKFGINMDGSGLMAMIPKDSLKAEKNVDSTFSFKKIFEAKKDSIAKLPKEEQAKLKSLENFDMRMKMNYDTKEFLFSMNTNFKTVAELQDVMSNMNTVQNLGKKKSEGNALASTGGFTNNNSVLHYLYDGKKFSRNAIINKTKIKKAENDSTEAYKMIYESSKYIIKYHFPKRVKKVSNATALFSDDRKTITIEYPFNEYMDNPEKLNFEVDFEK